MHHIVSIKLLYKCTKFHGLSITGLKVTGRGHFVPPPPPRCYTSQKSPVLIGLKLSKIDQFTEETFETRPQRQQMPSTTILPRKCIFCNGEKRLKNKGRENLTQCVETRAVTAIKLAAEKKEDFSILALLANDLIAKEAHYHKSCYKSYMRINYEQTKKVDRNQTTVEVVAYKEVVKYCHELQQKQQIVKFTTLTKILENVFKEKEEHLRDSVKKNLRYNLERDVKDIKFIHLENSLYVYPETLSFNKLLVDFIKMSNQLEKLNLENEKLNCLEHQEKTITTSMKYIRKEIQELQDNMPWPPQPTDWHLVNLKYHEDWISC